MTQEKDKLRPHEIDGIQEYDNALPQWWVGLFYFTILFGVGYLFYLHVMDGTSLEEELVADLKAREQMIAEQHAEQSQSSSEDGSVTSFADRVTDPAFIAAGKEIYNVNCVACHGMNGEGGIGPNLTDNHWLHGGSNEAILATISNGVAAKGMPGWKAVFGPLKTEQVAAFAISLIGTNPENAKAAQGELFTRE
jgi:Cytochrome c, mono- and diheme variants